MSEAKQELPGVEIPDKMFFKIREVSQVVGVKPHVLRYWETEFPTLAPKKNRNGQRIYTRKEIETALEIKKLLHVERFSIAGARQRLKSRRDVTSRRKTLLAVRESLLEIAQMLDPGVGAPPDADAPSGGSIG
ncbi:MAG: MerR family transcriptional regulator [Nitrospinota bacterium]|nr:MerR family transcriptional regulator [Nitrospinota bacterium]